MRGRHCLHCPLRADRHEDRRLDHAVPRAQPPAPRRRAGIGFQELEMIGHTFVILSAAKNPETVPSCKRPSGFFAAPGMTSTDPRMLHATVPRMVGPGSPARLT